MSIKCYDFFGCFRKNECPYYSYEGKKNCWEVAASLTPFVNISGAITQEEKKIHCIQCIYYQYMNDKKKVSGISP